MRIGTPNGRPLRAFFYLALLAWIISRLLILPLGWYEITRLRMPPGMTLIFQPIPEWPAQGSHLGIFLFILFPFIYFFESLSLHLFRRAFLPHRRGITPAWSVALAYFLVRFLLFTLLWWEFPGNIPLILVYASLLTGMIVWLHQIMHAKVWSSKPNLGH